MKNLDQYWYSANPVAWLLLPLSGLFCIVAVLRRFLYLKGFMARHAVPVPVIIVGNISVGGTGKTPLLIGLCDYLSRHGLKPGVVSRGYGADVNGTYSVSASDSAERCGDEPLLIRQRTGCPVIIGKDRVAAAKKLLAENECNLILSDDGLQHYRLRRNIEIAVVDAERRFGNGFCLPAGPLREPVSRLASVDMVVYHGDTDDDYHFYLEFGQAINLVSAETRYPDSFAIEPVHAVAGIGYPQRFFNQLRSLGLELIEHAFPDHHQFTASDIDFADGLPILMTEKDAVKFSSQSVSKFGDLLKNAWSLPVTEQLSDRLGPDLLLLTEQTR
jgi:tetraacyldisaccharide 4'-kinase